MREFDTILKAVLTYLTNDSSLMNLLCKDLHEQ